MVKECFLSYTNGNGTAIATIPKVMNEKRNKVRFDSIPDALADFGMLIHFHL